MQSAARIYKGFADKGIPIAHGVPVDDLFYWETFF